MGIGDFSFSARRVEDPPPSSNKRIGAEATLQVADVVRGSKRPRAIDIRSPCDFCHKPGHLADNSWVKFPEKKRSYNERGRRPNAPPLPLNNISTASLQAMIS